MTPTAITKKTVIVKRKKKVRKPESAYHHQRYGCDGHVYDSQDRWVGQFISFSAAQAYAKKHKGHRAEQGNRRPVPPVPTPPIKPVRKSAAKKRVKK